MTRTGGVAQYGRAWLQLVPLAHVPFELAALAERTVGNAQALVVLD